MSLFEEKRSKSNDRRVRNDGPPPGCRERRSKRDRRQTVISEISFHEWTRYFLRFKSRAMAKIESKARKPMASQALSLPCATPNVRIAVRREDDALDNYAIPLISS
jgi:hypothetical protein